MERGRDSAGASMANYRISTFTVSLVPPPLEGRADHTWLPPVPVWPIAGRPALTRRLNDGEHMPAFIWDMLGPSRRDGKKHLMRERASGIWDGTAAVARLALSRLGHGGREAL